MLQALITDLTDHPLYVELSDLRDRADAENMSLVYAFTRDGAEPGDQVIVGFCATATMINMLSMTIMEEAHD